MSISRGNRTTELPNYSTVYRYVYDRQNAVELTTTSGDVDSAFDYFTGTSSIIWPSYMILHHTHSVQRDDVVCTTSCIKYYSASLLKPSSSNSSSAATTTHQSLLLSKLWMIYLRSGKGSNEESNQSLSPGNNLSASTINEKSNVPLTAGKGEVRGFTSPWSFTGMMASPRQEGEQQRNAVRQSGSPAVLQSSPSWSC